MINMLKVLMIKVDNMQEQIGGNPEMEIPRKNREEMLEFKTHHFVLTKEITDSDKDNQ